MQTDNHDWQCTDGTGRGAVALDAGSKMLLDGFGGDYPDCAWVFNQQSVLLKLKLDNGKFPDITLSHLAYIFP